MVDFETTGLRTGHCTCLEVAWCVCDIAGYQRTLLRSRYLALTPEGAAEVLPSWRGQPRSVDWSHRNTADSTALTMAVDSGLADEWLKTPRNRILTRGNELSRLIADDLAYAVAADEPCHIAGSGVARFDFELLRLHCPAGVIGAVHYRAVDVSVALTALTGANSAAQLLAAHVASGGYCDIDVDVPPRCELMRTDDQIAAWVTEGAEPHRAAPDVARAIVTQRALWSGVGASLREGLA